MSEIAVAQGRDATPDGVLVQEAAAGSGVSYGALYDRYATQVFNYCLRLTGSTEDAADATQEAFVNVLRRLQDDDRPVLDFSSYLFAAARHESYGLMRQRARQRPSDTPPEERGRVADLETDPERSVLLRDEQEAVRQANAQLAPRHREVLALREVAGRTYDEVGEIMGISGNAAAQLIFRARGKLREALTAGAVASVVATSEECERAQMLLNRVQDGERVDAYDREWLDEHLEECGSCKTANRMLLEAGASYRLWAPVALLAGMRSDTLAEAGGVVGADWSHVLPPGKSAASSASSASSAGAGVAAVAGAVVVAAGIAFVALTGGDEIEKASAPAERPAADAPAVVESASAGGGNARSAAPDTTLSAARAPAGSRAPGETDPPLRGLERSDGPAPKGQPAPRGRPEGGPAPPPAAKPEPGPPEPKGEQPESPPSPPADPAPPDIAPPVDTAPAPPPPPTECNWPGGGGGPGGCPPGHGGVPPGQGGTPPGRAP